MASGGNDKKGGFGRSFGNLGGGLGGGFAKLGESIRQQADGIATKVGSATAGNSADGEGAERATLASEAAATVESTNSAASSAKSPDAVSKEELLEILQKMNKKVKALSTLRVQLTERVKKTEAEKQQLMTFVKDEILDQQHDIKEDGEKSDDVLAQLRAAWHATSERNQMIVQELQKEFKTVTLNCREEVEKVREVMQCEADAKIVTVRAEAMSEAMANAKDEWERSREKLIQQHRDEVAELREQFRDTQEKMLEYKEAAEKGTGTAGEGEKASSSEASTMSDEQVTAKISEMEKRHAAEMKKVKTVATAQLQKLKEKMLEYKAAADKAKEGAGTTEEGGERAVTDGQGGSTDVAEIERRHAEELKKVKTAASAQLQNFKKKVAAARAAEIEKLKKEMAEKINSSAAPVPAAGDNAEHEKQLQELRNAQQKELELIRTNLTSETKLMLEKEKEQWQSQQKDMEIRIREETHKSREVEFEKLRSEMNAPENDAEADAALVQINELKNSLKQAIEQSKKEGFDFLASQTEKAREDMTKLVESVREPTEGPRGEIGENSIEKRVAEVREELANASERVSNAEKKVESAQAAMATSENETQTLMERVNEELKAQRTEQEKVMQSVANVPTKELEAITAYRDAANERLGQTLLSLKASKEQELAEFSERIKQSDAKVEWGEDDNSVLLSLRQELSGQIQKIREDIEKAATNCDTRLQATVDVCSKTEIASQTLANATENARGILTAAVSVADESNNEAGTSLEDQIVMNQATLAKKRADLAKRYNQSCILNQQTQKELFNVKSRLAELQEALEVSKEQARSTAEGVEKELREELKSKDELLAQEQGERTSLETQVANLQEKLETALSRSKEYEELQSQCDQLREELSSKEGILSHEQSERASLETQITSLTEKLEAAASKAEEFEQMQSQCEELREEVKSKDDALALEKDERTSLETQMTTLQQNLEAVSATSEEHKALQEQYEKLREELQTKTESLTQGENERASLEAQTNSLNEQLSAAVAKVGEYGDIQAKYDQLLEKLKSNDDAISQEQVERASLENKLIALQEQLKAASSKLAEYGQVQEQCDQLREELKSKDGVIAQEQEQRSSLEAQISSLSETAATKATEYEELQSQCAQLQEELKSKEGVLSQEQNDRASSETQINALQEQLKAASSKLAEYGQVQEQCDQLREELKSKDGVIAQEQEQRSSLEAQISSLSETAATKATEYEELQSQCAQLQEELKSKEGVLSQEQNDRASSETQVNAMQEKLQAAANKLKKYAQVQKLCEQLRDKLKSKDEALSQEQNLRSALEVQLASLSEIAQGKANEHEDLQAQCAQLQAELKSKEGVLSQEQNERASSQAQITGLYEKLQAASSKLEEYEQVQAQCEQLREELKSKEGGLAQEQNQRSSLEAQIIAKEEEHSQNLRDAQKKIQELEKRHEEVCKEAANIRSTSLKDNLLPELKNAKSSINDTQVQHADLKRAQVEIQSSLRDLENEINTSVSKSVNLLTEMKTKMSKAQDELTNSKDSISSTALTTSSALADLKNTFSSEIHAQLQERESRAKRMITNLVEANKLQASAFAVALNDARAKYIASERATASMKEECEAQLKDARHTLKSITSLNSNQKEQSQVEIEKIKENYEAQLQAAEKKRKNAVELMNKLKQATAAKMKSIEEKHKNSLEKVMQEGETKVQNLRSQFESELAFVERAKRSSLQVLVSSSDAKLKELHMKQASSASDLNEQVGHLKSALLAELDSRLTEARNEKVETLASLEKTRESTSGALKEELNEKLKDLETKYSTAMKEADGRRVAALESAGSRFAITLQNVRKQHAKTTSSLGTNTDEYISKIESEIDKHFQSVLGTREQENNSLIQKGENLCGELKKMFDEKVQGIEEKHSVAVERLQGEMSGKDESFQKLVKQLKAAVIASSSLSEENTSLQEKLDSEMKSQAKLQAKLDSLEKELQDTVSNSSDTASSLLQQQEQLEQEKVKFQNEIEQLTQERDAGLEKSKDLKAKLNDVGAKLESTTKDRNDLDERLQEAAKKEAKLVETEKEVAVLRDQVNKLTLEQTKSSSLLSRLQAEKDASERKHGQRTALVGMLEEQLSELNEAKTETTAKLEAALYEIKQKNEAIESTTEKLRKAEAAVKEAQDARKAASESLTMAAKGTETKKNKMVESLQREIQSLQQQIARKSAAAQRMLKERETECVSLRKANKELQHELDKGSLSDRRIFELAAKQSNRDSVASSEIEIRDKVVERLTEKLLARDGELATAEHTVQKVEDQVEDLCRVRRREDVNLDYLKSIVVQYLSKPPGSSERAALLPVLATLLQFDANDYKAIEEGKQKLSWWGSVAPVLIGPSEEERPPPPANMEPSVVQQSAPLLSSTNEKKVSQISHTSVAPKTHSKGTSLQF